MDLAGPLPTTGSTPWPPTTRPKHRDLHRCPARPQLGLDPTGPGPPPELDPCQPLTTATDPYTDTPVCEICCQVGHDAGTCQFASRTDQPADGERHHPMDVDTMVDTDEESDTEMPDAPASPTGHGWLQNVRSVFGLRTNASPDLARDHAEDTPATNLPQPPTSAWATGLPQGWPLTVGTPPHHPDTTKADSNRTKADNHGLPATGPTRRCATASCSTPDRWNR